MRDVFSLERTTEILHDDPYIAAYPHLLEFFKTKTGFKKGDVVCGAHMVYGWMPTVLELYADTEGRDLESAAQLLERARVTGALNLADIKTLADLVNNSLVGATKLLHFVAPASFAIWDSRVYSYVHEERPHHYRISDVAKYRDYLDLLDALKKDPRFGSFHSSVNAKLRYGVSPLRALELIMFLNAPLYVG